MKVVLYAAMFDEVNEGTALFKVEWKHAATRFRMMRTWFIPSRMAVISHQMRLTGLANHYLRTGVAPPANISELARPARVGRIQTGSLNNGTIHALLTCLVVD
jgi:hypothetical protein